MSHKLHLIRDEPVVQVVNLLQTSERVFTLFHCFYSWALENFNFRRWSCLVLNNFRISFDAFTNDCEKEFFCLDRNIYCGTGAYSWQSVKLFSWNILKIAFILKLEARKEFNSNNTLFSWKIPVQEQKAKPWRSCEICLKLILRQQNYRFSDFSVKLPHRLRLCCKVSFLLLYFLSKKSAMEILGQSLNVVQS